MIIIDRFEGDIAVVETDSGMTDIQRSLIPKSAKEGDVLRWILGIYCVDYTRTRKRRDSAVSRFNRLRRRNND